jgi:hypothetical protein
LAPITLPFFSIKVVYLLSLSKAEVPEELLILPIDYISTFYTMLLSSLSGALCFIESLASAALIERQSAATSIYKPTGSGAWAEGMAVRPNGNILLNRLDVPEIWNIDPVTKTGTKLLSFTGAQSMAGITELAPDVWAVVTGSFNTKTFSVKAGSWSVYKVDLTGVTPTQTLVKSVPESGFFIGLTTFNNDTIFIADAGKGSLYKMTISTGDYSVIITDPSMKAPASAAIQEGIHGIKYYNGDVYFSSTFGDTFSKVKIDPTTLKAGAVTSILTGLQGPEDFAIGADGTSYLALMTKGQVLKITLDGKSSTVGSVTSATCVAFGRTDKDKNTLYVATSSGAVFSIPAS